MSALARHLAKAVLLLLLLPAGCARATPERLPTYPVTGQVFVNGQPAVGATVRLYGIDEPPLEGLCPHGVVEADGSFRLTTYKTGDGAPVGKYALTVKWPAPPPPGKDGDGPDRLKGRFANAAHPVRPVEITAADNDLGRIDLK